MNTKKPILTLEQEAESLVKEAIKMSNDYCLRFVVFPDSIQTIRHAIEYNWLLAQLRADKSYFHGRDPKEVVCEAMLQRFEMSYEDFATDILGG